MTAQSANTIGLILGIIGVTLIFIWGPPQPSLEPGVSIGIEDATPIYPSGKTVADHNREVAALRLRHIILSRVGLGLIGIGFFFQLCASWIPSVAQPRRNSTSTTIIEPNAQK